jgi:hypothetical protein
MTMSNAEKHQLADQIGLAGELGEPETIISVILAVAQRKPGEKWKNLADALEVAQERLERLNAPRAPRFVDLEGHIDASPKMEQR